MKKAVNWRHNLVALCVAQFGGFFAYSFVLPFSALYLHSDLGVRGESQLAIWTGVSLAANGLAMAAATPVWGILGDRFGRKQMVVRSMAGGAVAVGLMGIVMTPEQLVGTRLLLGLFAGISTATAALVIAETPREKVARALGWLGSALALGRTVGPLVGGALAVFFALRQVFFAGALMLAVATVVVVIYTNESARPLPERRGTMAAVRGLDGRARRAIAVVIASQGLAQWALSSSQGLLAIRVLALDPARANLLTGVAVAVGGVCTVITATLYSRPLAKYGFRAMSSAAAVVLFAACTVLGFAPSIIVVMAAMAAIGVSFGVLGPALSSMLGLEAPADAKATVISFGATSFALGLAFGPLVTGLITGVAGIGVALLSAGCAALLAGILLFAGGREPLSTPAVTTTASAGPLPRTGA